MDQGDPNSNKFRLFPLLQCSNALCMHSLTHALSGTRAWIGTIDATTASRLVRLLSSPFAFGLAQNCLSLSQLRLQVLVEQLLELRLNGFLELSGCTSQLPHVA